MTTHEPAGFKLIVDEPFDTLPPAKGKAAMALNRFYLETNPNRFHIVGSQINGLFPQGAKGGSAPFKMTLNFAPVKAVYQCIRFSLDPKFTNNKNAGTKFGFYLFNSSILNHYFNLFTPLGVHTQFNGTAYKGMNKVYDGKTCPRGRFLDMETLLDLGTGTVGLWVDGVQQKLVTGQQLTTSSAQKIKGVTLEPTYGGGKNPVPYDQTIQIDDWYVSVK